MLSILCIGASRLPMNVAAHTQKEFDKLKTEGALLATIPRITHARVRGLWTVELAASPSDGLGKFALYYKSTTRNQPSQAQPVHI
jgi:hypothetical protein